MISHLALMQWASREAAHEASGYFALGRDIVGTVYPCLSVWCYKIHILSDCMTIKFYCKNKMTTHKYMTSCQLVMVLRINVYILSNKCMYNPTQLLATKYFALGMLTAVVGSFPSRIYTVVMYLQATPTQSACCKCVVNNKLALRLCLHL